MKKAILILLVLLVLAAGLFAGPRIAEYQGYILVVMEHGTLQMSVLGLMLAVAIGIMVAVLIWWVVKTLWRLFAGSQNWLWTLSERKRTKAFRRALILMAEGDNHQAVKLLDGIEDHDFDGINLLAAADLQLRLENPDEAILSWQKAALHPASQTAANINLMRHYLSMKQPKLALKIVDTLDEKQQKNKLIVPLWAQALAEDDQWQQLKEHLPYWKKILGKEPLAYWQQRLAKGRFAEIASKAGANELMQDWQNQSRAVRKDPNQQAAYVQQLIEQGMHVEAEKALVEFQKRTVHPALLQLFTQLVLTNPLPSIRFLEQRIKMDSNNGQLFSVLGHVAFNAKDYPLAEKALTKAIHLSNQQEDVLLLAQISEIQHNNQQALQLYKKSLVG